MPKNKGPVIIDGVDTTPLSREKLVKLAIKIKEENDREREQQTFFQLERDKIKTFWDISRNELEEAQASLRNKDRQIEEQRAENEKELQFYRQKVKHSQYENQVSLTEANAAAIVSLQKEQTDFSTQEAELADDNRVLRQQIKNQEYLHQEKMKSLNLSHSEEISKIREEFQKKVKEIEMKYDKKFATLQQQLSVKHKAEMAEVEQRKNTQISLLKGQNDATFNDLKNYYNDITLNNLALISSLKEEMETLRKQNERLSKQSSDIVLEHHKTKESLKTYSAEVVEMKKELENYSKDKSLLASKIAKLKVTKEKLIDLRWSHEVVETSFERVKAERDELQKRLVRAVLDVQQKTCLKNELLNRRIDNLTYAAENQEIQIDQLKIQTDLSDEAINKKYEKLLKAKNCVIQDLEYELARISKAHEDILETYEEKLIKYGVPKCELGFRPDRFGLKSKSILERGQGLINLSNLSFLQSDTKLTL